MVSGNVLVKEKNNTVNISLFKKEKLAEVNRNLDREQIKEQLKENHISTEMKCLYNEEEIFAVYNTFKSKVESNKHASVAFQHVAIRNLTMFVCAISIGLRGGDFCSLKWSDIFEERHEDCWVYLDCPDYIPEKTIRIDKNGNTKYKKVKLYWNSDFEKALSDYLVWKIDNGFSVSINDYIFTSRKGGCIGRKEWYKIVEATRKEAGIQQKIGTHGLRKTMVHSYIENAEDKSEAVVQVSSQLNHSSTRVTLRYACIEDQGIKDNKERTACIFK